MKKILLLTFSLLLALPISSFAKKPMRVTILCYNVQIGKRADIDQYVEFAKKYNPDIIALQEVDYMTNRMKRHSDFAGQLAEKMGMHSAYEATLHFSGGQYGIALLSKFPIDRVRAFSLPEFKHSYERRAALNMIVYPSKKQKLSITCTHLDLPKGTRDAQVAAITKWLPEDIPAVMCGDFNARPDDPAIAIAKESWQQMCNDDYTFPNTSPNRKIDYIFAKGPGTWRTVSYQRIAECPLSDHCPMIITLEYTE